MIPLSTIRRLNAYRAARHKKQSAVERPKALMKPNAQYARNRAAQLTGERRERFLEAVKEVLS